MMYVVCFYWQGDRWQEYDHQDPPGYNNLFKAHLKKTGKIDDQLASIYVNNLYKGVANFASEEFKFICFTNEELDLYEDIEMRRFPLYTRCGVLPRMHMFSEEAGLFGHQVLCLDLDIVITGTLKDIMGYRGQLCAQSNVHGNLDGDIISFRAGPETEGIFWKPFIRDVEKAERVSMGRERFWMRYVIGDNYWVSWNEVAPGQIISYKKVLRNQINKKLKLKGVSIVSCNGVHRPHQIDEGWIKKYWENTKRWDFLNKVIQDKGFKIGAEVGTGNGETFQRLMEANPELKMIEVAHYPKKVSYKSYRSNQSGRLAKNRFVKTITPHDGRVEVLWKPSEKAVEEVKDESLDFVFIDANHDYEYVLQDIRLWYQKVKSGGLICGHDYNNKFPGVKRAVKRSFDNYETTYDSVWYRWKK
jgi:hypothetical protein